MEQLGGFDIAPAQRPDDLGDSRHVAIAILRHVENERGDALSFIEYPSFRWCDINSANPNGDKL